MKPNGKSPFLHALSRRERQIMNALFRFGKATVADVRQALPNPPTEPAVRRMLSILEEKGFVQHEWDGPRYLYSSKIAKQQASESALKDLATTYFDGSPIKAAAALFEMSDDTYTDEELALLEAMIVKAKKEGR